MAKSRFKNENLFTYFWTSEVHSGSRESWFVILWLKSSSFFLSSFFLRSCWVKLGKPPPKLLVLDSAPIISESYTNPTLWSSNLCLRNSRMGINVSTASYGSALEPGGPVQLKPQAWEQIFYERRNKWWRAEKTLNAVAFKMYFLLLFILKIQLLGERVPLFRPGRPASLHPK